MTHSLVPLAAKVQPVAVPFTPSPPNQELPGATPSLAALWARKYFVSVTSRADAEQLKNTESLSETTSKEGRARTVAKLTRSLTLASAQAWSLTETLLADEIQRHGIDRELINPWQIAADSHGLFRKALTAYSDRITPRRLSVMLGHEFGRVRQNYTVNDSRIIGFVSMQFHYTGKMLLDQLSPAERSLFEPYLKVMDDHLYMPLRNAYDAAGNHDLDSPALAAVQQLLPLSTRIAHAVCNQVCRTHPHYRSYSGALSSTAVRTSSVRDVEMFQVYLCLCALEGSVHPVQQELFPLCVMLYPPLQVSWALVQNMLQTLSWEMHDRLPAEQMAVFLPYLQTFMEMFSTEVFGNS